MPQNDEIPGYTGQDVFVFDLDETLIHARHSENSIHPDHKVSGRRKALMRIGKNKAQVLAGPINPTETSAVFNAISMNPSNKIMILTAGCYDPDSMLNFLKGIRGLSQAAKDKLSHASFHNPETDEKYFPGKNALDIRHVEKADRLEAIVAAHPELKNSRFIVVDDYEHHIESFKRSAAEGRLKVIPILATTDMEYNGDKSFYKEILKHVHVLRSLFAPKPTVNPAPVAVVPAVTKAQEPAEKNRVI